MKRDIFIPKRRIQQRVLKPNPPNQDNNPQNPNDQYEEYP